MAECAPCPCDQVPSPNFAAGGFGYVQIMVNRVVQHCRQRAEGVSQYRVLQIGLGGGTFSSVVRARCDAHVDVIEKQQDVADAARNFMGFSGNTDEHLIIANAVDGLQELETFVCKRLRANTEPRTPTTRPLCLPACAARGRRCDRHRLHGERYHSAWLQVESLR